MKPHLTIIGGGSGEPKYLLPAAQEAISQAERVITSKRFERLVPEEKFHPMPRIDQLLEQLPKLVQQQQIAVIVSGDPLFYSLCRTILSRFPDWEIAMIPGIGALQLMGAAFHLTMEEAAVLSLHGRECTAGKIAATVSTHPVTFFFCSKEQGPVEIAAALLSHGLENATLCIGASLGTEQQTLQRLSPTAAVQVQNPALCMTAVCNPAPQTRTLPALLPDSAFLRNQSPMTKAEIRMIAIGKLQLHSEAIVWDIGAGTGSISVECARMCRFGEVYAIEYKEAALEILKKNQMHFTLHNLHILAGKAGEQVDLSTLPVPDCIFIGGSDGALQNMVSQIVQFPKNIRLVITAVTVETQAEVFSLLESLPNFEATQVQIGHTKKIGSYHVWEQNHPVVIFSCDTKAE